MIRIGQKSEVLHPNLNEVKMRSLFLSLLLGIQCLVYPEVVETPYISEVAEDFPPHAWILLDLDNTVYEGGEALGHAGWFYQEVGRRMDEGMSHEQALEDFYPLWIASQAINSVKPLEDELIDLIKVWQAEGRTVFAVTHRTPLLHDATLRQVRSLGICFDPSAPYSGSLTFEGDAQTSIYNEGVLFVGDKNSKAEVLQRFFQRIGQTPGAVVFVDDKKANSLDLELAFKPMGIEYLGIFYTAFERSTVYDPNLAEIQYPFLNGIMSNELARRIQLMNEQS